MKAVRSAVVAAATTRLGYGLLRSRPPGGDALWTRTNHRGEPVSLLEGPAVTIGAVAGLLASTPGNRSSAAAVVAGIGAAGFGGYDDLKGNGDRRGFRGHIGALRNGEFTTGAVKLAGIGMTGLAAAIVAGTQAGHLGGCAGSSATGPGPAELCAPGSGPGLLAAADLLINAGLIAGGANLLNLFDLRPGRALKVAGAAGSLLAARGARPETVAPLAAAAALLPEDLGERAMLGDAGANGLGAMLGVAAATSLSRPARVAALAAVIGLTAASEVVSFTQVIERTGPLRRLDMLGRRPAAAAGTGEPGEPGKAGLRGASPAEHRAADSDAPGPSGNGERVPEGLRSAEVR